MKKITQSLDGPRGYLIKKFSKGPKWTKRLHNKKFPKSPKGQKDTPKQTAAKYKQDILTKSEEYEEK